MAALCQIALTACCLLCLRPYPLILARFYRLLCIDLTSWCAGYRSNNFIVGLTNVSPVDSPPTIWNYTVCGQYPGIVPVGATVSLYCQDNLPPFRYVIVQFPITDHMNFCEFEVLVRGMIKIFNARHILCKRDCMSCMITSRLGIRLSVCKWQNIQENIYTPVAT